MKSVWAAGILFVLLLTLSSFNSIYVIRRTDALLAITEGFASDAEQMEAAAEKTAMRAEALADEWNRVFPYFSYVTGYTALNRADDAVIELCNAVRSGSYPDAVTARAKLLDALLRMRALETLTPGSVF